tara:strand:+ start:2713 stop:3240 length:528 start_codon:yes stop_codon:yes gene_type:complete
MARLDYSISVTPIQSASLEGQTIEAIEADIGRGLSASKSDSAWGGTAPTWSNNNAGHKQSRTSANTIATVATTDGLWIKHTGFKYDSGLTSTAETTTKITISRTVTLVEINATATLNAAGNGEITLSGPAAGLNVQIAVLQSGQGIFLPTPGAATWVLTDDAAGQAVAVEYAELR